MPDRLGTECAMARGAVSVRAGAPVAGSFEALLGSRHLQYHKPRVGPMRRLEILLRALDAAAATTVHVIVEEPDVEPGRRGFVGARSASTRGRDTTGNDAR